MDFIRQHPFLFCAALAFVIETAALSLAILSLHVEKYVRTKFNK